MSSAPSLASLANASPSRFPAALGDVPEVAADAIQYAPFFVPIFTLPKLSAAEILAIKKSLAAQSLGGASKQTKFKHGGAHHSEMTGKQANLATAANESPFARAK